MDNIESGMNAQNPALSAYFMPRPRISAILDRATRCKLVYVVAGAGYGKTQAVRHYIEQQPDAVVRWVQLTENDNIGSRYWENLTYNISFDNPDLADKLKEFGFPDTPTRFRQFAQILKDAEHRSNKTFLVLDDFHSIHSEQALTFAERCAYLLIPGACVIIIGRKEPEINAVSLFAKGQAHLITEEELRFTDEEIADYLRQQSIAFSLKNLTRFINATGGWALAVQLLSLSLKRKAESLDFAIGVMRQNIFKLMEIEAFNDFPESVRKILVRLSLVCLPLKVLRRLFSDVPIIQNPPQLASFIWLDSLTGEDRVHPLYWEFLQSKQGILSEDETRETYRRAAEWCSQNNFRLDAMYYLAKLRDYARMAEFLYESPFKLPPDTCAYFLNIIEGLDPNGEESGDINLLTLKKFFAPLLLMGMGRYEEAREMTFGIIKEWENSGDSVAPFLLCSGYSNLAYIDMYICTVTHEYEAHNYIKKSLEYFNPSWLPLSGVSGAFYVADVRSLACLVGEGADAHKLGLFLDSLKKSAVYIAETSHNMYYGYEDLVHCELAFFRNQPDTAKYHAHQAILKAREKNQYSIEAMAAQYLLRISMQEGDYPQAKEILRQLRAHLDNPVFWNRQLLYDLFTGFFYAQIGLPGMAPSWLALNETETTSEVRIPIRELIVCVKSHIASKQYNRALTVLCNSYPRDPRERFLLSELTFSLLTAVARIQTGDAPGAVKDLEKAYELSFNGEFEMPFIELGKNLRPLAAAAAREACGIPGEWLKTMERKASAYAKKTAVIANSFKQEKNIKDTVKLSERESEVLSDLYHGLSREEIAANRYLSINTVKKILQSIFIKLDANNNVDAIRVGLEKKLIE